MALVGGGGAGFTAGSPSSVGQGLYYLGEHAYGFSGELASTNSSLVHFDFSTGGSYFVGRVTCNGAAKVSDPTVGRTSIWQLKFNDELVASMKTDTVEEDQPGTVYNDIIIPPYTKVELTCRSDTSTADRLTSAAITGRVYA